MEPKKKIQEPAQFNEYQLKFWESVIDKGFPLYERYLNTKIEHLEKPKFRWSLIAFVLILTIVVLVTAFLVYHDKVDGANFTFLLGTLVGATITLIGDLLIPKE